MPRLRDGLRALGLLVVVLGLSGCARSYNLFEVMTGEAEQPPDTTRAYSVFLIGDAGEPRSNPTEPSLRLLKQMVDEAGPNSAVVFLGDNIYPSGLPGPNSRLRPEAERRINEQLAAVADHEGQIIFLPGNHDWGNSGVGGSRTTLRRQELYVERVLDRGNTFLPDRGYPGPVAVELSPDIVLVALDTQWWMEKRKPYGDTGQYEVEQEASVLLELDDLLRRNEGKKLVVVAHHPIFSNGSHGGLFQSNLAPIPLTRRYLGTPQDLSNYNYRRLRRGLMAVFGQHEGLVYAAGHEHSLQYFSNGGQHYVVSGSGTKSSFVAERRGASFVTDQKGFARLQYYTDGSVWLEFWVPRDGGAEGERVYTMRLEEGTRPLTVYQPPVDEEGVEIQVDTTAVVAGATENADDIDRDNEPRGSNGDTVRKSIASRTPYMFAALDTVVVDAGSYNLRGPTEWLYGRRYRDVWPHPVRVPVIDLERTAGGLTPIKKGGGFQTASLRLRGEDGDEYVLRSVNKDPSRMLPEYLRDTVVDELVEDQNSAMHPYGALVVPHLAEAAGIYHTAPTLVVVPDDPRLGIYRREFAGMLAIFESRPDEEQRDELRFGQPEEIISSTRLFEELIADHDEQIDAPFYARSRLFDMWIGDWDRHADQWRWARFEPHELDPSLEGEDRTRGNRYRPIPRDRDFAFYKFDGLLARLAQLAGGERASKLTNFGPSITNVKGLNFNGNALDNRLAAPLTRADWIAAAESLQVRLTDARIEDAVRVLPPGVLESTGPFLVESLKARRAQLPEVAARYYDLLARQVDVIGSNQDEVFVVRRLNDRDTEIAMYHRKDDGEAGRELFRRVFHRNETREVRLYGLGGLDEFRFEGESKGGVKVRAIGGFGEDRYVDAADGAGLNRIYDAPDGNVLEVGPRTEVYAIADPDHNLYHSRRYPKGGWGTVFSYNQRGDDGVFLGVGMRQLNTGFLIEPYHSMQEWFFRKAVQTDAFTASYRLRYTDLVGSWDGQLAADLLGRHSIVNYYGMGNDTDGSVENRNRYRAEYSQLLIEPTLRTVPGIFRNLHVGLRLESTDVSPEGGSPEPGTPESGYTADDMRQKTYVGVQVGFDVYGTDTLAFRRTGAEWHNHVSYNQGVKNTTNRYLGLSSELSYFYPFEAPGSLTLAFRVGGGTNIGDFEFYQARFIGGRSTVRGFPKHRYAGHTNFYNNIELRARLFDYNVYVTRGDLGVLAFFDHGRVWAKNDGGPWHAGFGGGVWGNPFGRFIFNATYGITPTQGSSLDFHLKFFF